jgi:tetratricopeptide (TPR) repeat protein
MNSQAEQLNNEGVQYFLQGVFSKAKEKYFEALDLSPEYTTTLNNLGLLFLQEKEYKKAEEHFKKAISLDEKPNYLNNLGHVYANQNEFSLAEAQYIKAIEKDNSSVMAYKSLASLYQYTGNYKNSIEIWKYIATELSNDVRFKLSWAKDLIHTEKYVEAMNLLLEITQGNTQQDVAYYYISLIQFQKKNFGLALDSIYRSLSMSPNNISYRKLAATLHLSLSNFDKAEKEWDFILTVNKNNHEVRIDKAIGLISIKKFDAALKELEYILRKEKHTKAAFYKALILLELKQDEDEAIKTLKTMAKSTSAYAEKAQEYLQQIAW